jgi:hypothetical protein
MKVELKISENKNKPLRFPVLARWRHSPELWLFRNEKSAVCVTGYKGQPSITVSDDMGDINAEIHSEYWTVEAEYGPKQPEPKLEFPLLAKYIGTTNHKTNPDYLLVVRFESEKVGQPLIVSGKPTSRTTESGWRSVTDKSEWEILPAGSQVIITQD